MAVQSNCTIIQGIEDCFTWRDFSVFSFDYSASLLSEKSKNFDTKLYFIDTDTKTKYLANHVQELNDFIVEVSRH